MLYPSADEMERRKANAFTAQYLAGPLREFHAKGGQLTYAKLARLSEDSGYPLRDIETRWWNGTAIGEMFKALFALANTDASIASWNNAIELAIRVTARSRVTGSRSTLSEVKRQFLPAAHLWAAWVIRGGSFASRPEVGYDEYADFQSFLAEAEILRHWGQNWRPQRSKAEPPLPKDIWQVSEGWRPLDRKPDWPQTGVVPYLTIPTELTSDFRPAGRPRKSQ